MNVIGIDIGGTQIKGAVVESSGNILSEVKVNTDISGSRTSILQGLNKVIEDLLNNSPDVEAIGIASAGRIDTINGVVSFATENLPGWIGFELRNYIKEKYHLPVIIDNDANCALIGEKWLGCGSGYSDIIMITLGTGVGGAGIVNNKLLHGSHFNGCELGHVVLYPNGKKCNCGQYGCIEQYVSGTALMNRAKENNLKLNHGKDIFTLVASNNQKAIETLDGFISDLAITIHNINNSFDPELIIIGGGVINSKDNFWHILLEKLDTNRQIKSEIKPAILKNRAGLIGSAKLALDLIVRGDTND